MKTVLWGGVLLLSGLLTGCISGNFDYTPPVKTAYKDKRSQIIIEATVERVWSRFLEKINTSDFQIETIDLPNHILSLSVTPLDSCAFIDCGEFYSYVKDPLSESREYLYKGCIDSVSYERESGGSVMNLSRHASLNIRSEIAFKPYNNKTIAVINSDYLFDKNYLFSDKSGVLLRKTNSEVTFTNKVQGDDTYGNEYGSVCVATGDFESTLISMIKGDLEEGQY